MPAIYRNLSALQATTLVAAVALLAGCATPPVPMPKDMHAVQATAPGQATCMATTAAANAAGAQVTNSTRHRAGLPPVRANSLLAQVASAHACDMAQRGRMTHLGSKTTGPGPRVKARGYAPLLTAENIAAGPFNLPRVLSEWEASQGHRNNILLPQVQDYGIGQALAADGKTMFWAAVYAAPKQ